LLFGLISITEAEIIVNGFIIKNDFGKAFVSVGGIIENPEMYRKKRGCV